MPRTQLKTAAGVPAVSAPVAANDRLTGTPAGRAFALELHATGGTAVVRIQSRTSTGSWEDLTLDSGETTIPLADNVATAVYIARPVEDVGVFVVSKVGATLLTAAIVSREIY